MRLVRDRAVVDDGFVRAGDEGELPDGADVIVPYARWQRERDSLASRAGRLGVCVPSDARASELGPDAGVFAVIAIELPKFGDGRVYTIARLLRDRYAYRGELRAVGNVLRDQFLLMLRCGFDAFEVKDESAVEAWHEATSEIAFTYQPTGRQRASIGVLGRVGAKS